MHRLAHARFLTILGAVIISVSCVSTQQGEIAEPKDPEEHKPAVADDETGSWKPPDPKPDESDWIRMSSGEWLRGEIEFLRRDDLEFESDDLGDLEIDWDDVVELRSPRINACLFAGGETAVGTLLIRDGWVIVGEAEGMERRFRRASLRTIVPGEPKEFNYWRGKIGAGFTSRSGNTDQTDYTGYVNLLRRTLESRYALEYIGNYGKLEGEVNVNNHRLNTKYDIFLTRRLYLTPLALEAYRDIFQNIDYRLTPSTGLGYLLIDEGDLEWDVEGQFGYQRIRYDSVAPGQDGSESETVVIGNTLYEMDLTKDVELEMEYRIQSISSDLRKANQHARSGISIDVGDLLDLNLMFVWDRVGDPERESSGDVPKKNDYRFIVGLELEF